MSVRDELLALGDNNGLIHAERGVEWAQDHPQSDLYAALEWDDGKAAHAHRVWQVRRLIAIHIVSENGERKMISLELDRANGGGYRDLDAVLSNADMRRQAIVQALGELQRWAERNSHLGELVVLFRAIDRMTRKFPKKPPDEAVA